MIQGKDSTGRNYERNKIANLKLKIYRSKFFAENFFKETSFEAYFCTMKQV